MTTLTLVINLQVSPIIYFKNVNMDITELKLLITRDLNLHNSYIEYENSIYNNSTNNTNTTIHTYNAVLCTMLEIQQDYLIESENDIEAVYREIVIPIVEENNYTLVCYAARFQMLTQILHSKQKIQLRQPDGYFGVG